MRAGTVTASLVVCLSASLAVGALPTAASTGERSEGSPSDAAPVEYIPYGSAYVDGLGDDAPYEYVQTPGSPASLRPLWTEYPTTSIYGYDFSADTQTLYGVETNSGDLVVVNQATGEQEYAGYLYKHHAWHIWTDLTIDPTTGTAYAATASPGSPETTVYRIDLVAAETTELMTVPMVGLLDMSMNCQGELYGIDKIADQLVRVDLATGLMIPIGPIGYDVEYAQGMDFDNSTGLLHAWLYTRSERGVYASVDTSTGRATPFPGVFPDGEYEGAIKTTCGSRPAFDCAELEAEVIGAAAARDKARKRLDKAKKSENPRKIKKARKALRKASRALKKAEGARAAAQCGVPA